MTNTLGNPTMGFQTFQRLDGGSPTAGMTPVWIASTDTGLIFRGDPVMTSSGGGTNNSGAYITSLNTVSSITASTAAWLCRGVFQGCYQYQPAAGRIVWSNFYNGTVTGSTGDIKAYIVDDPQELFLVQGSTKATILSSYVGLNIGMTVATSSLGNTTTGYSNVTIESCSATATALQFRIVGFYSDWALPTGVTGPAGAGTTPWINGTDNTSVANMLVVRLNLCDRLTTTARSS